MHSIPLTKPPHFLKLVEMTKRLKTLLFALILGCSGALHAEADAPKVVEPVIVVDKKTNTLHVMEYHDGKLDIVKTYRATTGKLTGDKLMEGDLKTPEGIYDFLYFNKAPALKPKFGPLAVYVGYPNPMDRTGKKTGFDILIHGTDDPSRLERPFDSLGCVVTDNANVKEICDVIRLKETKVIITKDYSNLANTPRLARAKIFFDSWLKAWQNKDMPAYIESYADEFRIDGMDRLDYAKYKQKLAEKYESIEITASNVKYYFHEKYDLITFTQHYKSTLKGGIPAYNGTSRKYLYVQERNGIYRIVIEDAKK